MEEEYLDDDDFLYGRNGEAGGAGDGAAVVGSRSGAAASGSSGLSGLEDVFADDAGVADVVENEDVALLKRLVLNERGAPEILPYNERVVDELLEIVRNQQEVVEDLREDVDEALEGNLVSATTAFEVVVVEWFGAHVLLVITILTLTPRTVSDGA